MNYEDVDFLFRQNYAVSPALIDIPPEGLYDTMRAIREMTGITFGRDLGAVLRNCPELWVFDPYSLIIRFSHFLDKFYTLTSVVESFLENFLISK